MVCIDSYDIVPTPPTIDVDTTPLKPASHDEPDPPSHAIATTDDDSNPSVVIGGEVVVKDTPSPSTTTRDPVAVEQDKEEKKRLVVSTISSHVTAMASHFEDFAIIASALNTGDELVAEVISGGYTNFSYKVHLKRYDDANDVALFAKLSFPYALWNPDPDVHYDIVRTENEFATMQMMHDVMGNDAPVAIPYLCVDVIQHDMTMKLLVTQWSKDADEQWANQFIDGHIDVRVVPKFAQTLATLHTSDFDPMYNDNVRPCMTTLFPAMSTKLQELLDLPDIEDNSRVAQFAKDLGKETCRAIVDANLSNYNDRDCLVHSDAHAFNVLVETTKPPTGAGADGENMVLCDGTFGPNGAVMLVDWEMVFAGPIGRDVGLAYSWPISCLLAHAANGHARIVQDDFLNFFDVLWNEYAQVLVQKGGRDDEFLRTTYRNCIAWAGWMVFLAHYILRAQIEFLPVEDSTATMEDDNDNKEDLLLDSIGYVGLNFLYLGYSDEDGNEDLTISEIRERFRGILRKEVDILDKLLAPKRKRAMRRSVLRTTGRRVSDAALHLSLTQKDRTATTIHG